VSVAAASRQAAAIRTVANKGFMISKTASMAARSLLIGLG
jgi:hypothetical protein